MIKFSVIVPVYNIEKYISICIESILNQNLDSYELILVNDGSTDSSGSICDKYALSNENISVIHKENGGLSDARNKGMAKANGEYIIFIDSDDYIEPETLEKFNQKLSDSDNPDVMITMMKEVYEDSKTKYLDSKMPVELITNGNKEDVVNWMFRHSKSLWPAPRYVVKRSIIEKNNLCFAVGYLHEDVDWTCKLFLCANTFTAIDFYWYNYRIGRQGAITNHKKPKRTLDVIDLVSSNIKDNRYNYIDAKLRDVIFQRLVRTLFASLSDYKFYDVEDRKKVIKALKNNKNIFKYTTEFRHKIFIYVSKVCGFNVSFSLMNIFHKV